MSKEYQREYYLKNRERILKNAKQRYIDNPDAFLIREKERRKKYGKSFNEKRQERFKSDPKKHEEYKKYQREYYKMRKQNKIKGDATNGA